MKPKMGVKIKIKKDMMRVWLCTISWCLLVKPVKSLWTGNGQWTLTYNKRKRQIGNILHSHPNSHGMPAAYEMHPNEVSVGLGPLCSRCSVCSLPLWLPYSDSSSILTPFPISHSFNVNCLQRIGNLGPICICFVVLGNSRAIDSLSSRWIWVNCEVKTEQTVRPSKC